MNNSSLEHFTKELAKHWQPVNSALTYKAKQLLEQLAKNCLEEDWYQELVRNQSPAEEIYRDEQHGFVLMGHVENEGELSPPHDHGNGWVLYSTVTGQVKMGIYHKIVRPNGELTLVQKDSYVLAAGKCSIYLPGDIHDTHTIENNTVMLRLTSCDFNKEVEEGRLIRFTQTTEKW